MWLKRSWPCNLRRPGLTHCSTWSHDSSHSHGVQVISINHACQVISRNHASRILHACRQCPVYYKSLVHQCCAIVISVYALCHHFCTDKGANTDKSGRASAAARINRVASLHKPHTGTTSRKILQSRRNMTWHTHTQKTTHNSLSTHLYFHREHIHVSILCHEASNLHRHPSALLG